MVKQKKQIPEPQSKFLLVKCKECEHEQVVFGNATRVVTCEVCGKNLTEPTGGKASVLGEILSVLG